MERNESRPSKLRPAVQFQVAPVRSSATVHHGRSLLSLSLSLSHFAVEMMAGLLLLQWLLQMINFRCGKLIMEAELEVERIRQIIDPVALQIR